MNRSKNYIINQAVGGYLEREVLSDHRWQETLPAMGEARGVPADEVYEWLRSKGTDNELPRPKSK
jgi:predicted transcriptional regulator